MNDALKIYLKYFMSFIDPTSSRIIYMKLCRVIYLILAKYKNGQRQN